MGVARIMVITPHAGADSLQESLKSWNCDALVVNGRAGMLSALERGWREHEAKFYCFIHDDVIIHDENWQNRIMTEFLDPSVGLCGLGGALGHGSPELYKVPYDYHQLGRSEFLSNMDDAEIHGKRFTGSCDVAVLDGFALIVRRQILETAGGWPVT